MHLLTSIFFPKYVTTAQVATPQEAKNSCLLLLLITDIALSAIRKFKEGNLLQFDALVGDTSCQLRTIYIQKFRSDPLVAERLDATEERLTLFKTGLKKLLAEPFVFEQRGTPPLEEFMLSHPDFIKSLAITKQGIRQDLLQAQLGKFAGKNTTLYLSKEEQFMILSHTLFRTRSHENMHVTDETNLTEGLGEDSNSIDRKTCTEITTQTKRSLASFSVSFIQQMARAQSVFLGEVLKKSITHSVNLPCAPCFYTIEVILNEICSARRILLLKVGDKCFPFISEDGAHFSLLENPEERSAEPAFVIEGISSKPMALQHLLEEEDPIEEYPFSRVKSILLMNAAAHPQYTANLKHEKIALLKAGSEIAEKIKAKVDPLRATTVEIKAAMDEERFPFDLEQKRKSCQPVSIEEITLANLRIDALAKRAREVGCIEGDSRLFAIQHIYSNLLSNELIHNVNYDRRLSAL